MSEEFCEGLETFKRNAMMCRVKQKTKMNLPNANRCKPCSESYGQSFCSLCGCSSCSEYRKES